MSGQEEDTKPADASIYVNLIIVEVKGRNEAFFRFKRDTKLEVLMNAYCIRQSADFGAFMFVFGGRCLRGHDTPDELGMEDGDMIFALRWRRDKTLF